MAAKSLGPANVSHPDAAHVPKYLHPCVDYQICILRDVSPKSQIPVPAHILSTARASGAPQSGSVQMELRANPNLHTRPSAKLAPRPRQLAALSVAYILD